MEKCSISARFWKKGGYLSMAIIKNYPVENGVNDISQGPGKNERDAEDQNFRRLFSYRIPKPISYSANGDNPKKGKDKLSVCSRDFGAPGHSFIFNKKYSKPIKNRNFFP